MTSKFSLSLENGEGKCGIAHIRYAFEKYIELDSSQKGNNETSWYKTCSLDKSDASKIRRGIMIPPKYIRFKICKYFSKNLKVHVDSAMIWRREDMDEIRKLLRTQKFSYSNKAQRGSTMYVTSEPCLSSNKKIKKINEDSK